MTPPPGWAERPFDPAAHWVTRRPPPRRRHPRRAASQRRCPSGRTPWTHRSHWSRRRTVGGDEDEVRLATSAGLDQELAGASHDDLLSGSQTVPNDAVDAGGMLHANPATMSSPMAPFTCPPFAIAGRGTEPEQRPIRLAAFAVASPHPRVSSCTRRWAGDGRGTAAHRFGRSVRTLVVALIAHKTLRKAVSVRGWQKPRRDSP